MQNEDDSRGTKRSSSNVSAPNLQGDEKVSKIVDVLDINRAGGLRLLVHTLPFQPFATPPLEDTIVCVEIPNLPNPPSLVIGKYKPYGLISINNDYDFIVEHAGQQSTRVTIPKSSGTPSQHYPINFATARWINVQLILQQMMGGRQIKRLRQRKGRGKSCRRSRRKGKRTRSKW